MSNVPDNFYARTAEDRVALTREAIQQGRTLIERWRDLEKENTRGWLKRAKIAAKWLAEEPVVIDLGCGVQLLESCLPATTTYAPIDVVARDDRTLVVDLNREPLPDLPGNAVAALGLLEYIFEPTALVHRLSTRFATVVASYNPIDAPRAHAHRDEHGWVNAFTTHDVERLFASCDYRFDKRYKPDDRQVMWRFRRDHLAEVRE